MPETLTWDHPDVVALRRREDKEGLARLVREGRLALNPANPYARLIPVDASPTAGQTDDPPGGQGEPAEPLTRAEFDRLRREGRLTELRDAAKAGRIPWSPTNPYAPHPSQPTEGAD